MLPVLGHEWSGFHHLAYNDDHLVGLLCKTLSDHSHNLPWTTHMKVLDNLQQNNWKHQYNTIRKLNYIIKHSIFKKTLKIGDNYQFPLAIISNLKLEECFPFLLNDGFCFTKHSLLFCHASLTLHLKNSERQQSLN